MRFTGLQHFAFCAWMKLNICKNREGDESFLQYWSLIHSPEAFSFFLFLILSFFLCLPGTFNDYL